MARWPSLQVVRRYDNRHELLGFFLYKPGKHCNLYLSPPFSAFPLLCFHTPKDVLYRNYEFKAAGAQLVIKGTHGVNFLFRNLI